MADAVDHLVFGVPDLARGIDLIEPAPSSAGLRRSSPCPPNLPPDMREEVARL